MKNRKHYVRRCDPDGCIVWLDNGKEVVIKLPNGGAADLRVNPPFAMILPCPWCGSCSASAESHVGILHIGFEGAALPGYDLVEENGVVGWHDQSFIVEAEHAIVKARKK